MKILALIALQVLALIALLVPAFVPVLLCFLVAAGLIAELLLIVCIGTFAGCYVHDARKKQG